MNRKLIVNADDFGASSGINRGIREAHVNGVVTSASLMVTGQAAEEAAAIAKQHGDLSVGLHWDIYGEEDRSTIDARDVEAAHKELDRQLVEFEKLMGRLPSHLDSHRHAHRSPHLLPAFISAGAELGIPLRGTDHVRYVGGFYGQWEWMVTDLTHISVDYLQWLFREEVGEGWTEIACHPGYVSEDFQSVYLSEREYELQTLTDQRIAEALKDERIELVNYDDYRRSSSGNAAS